MDKLVGNRGQRACAKRLLLAFLLACLARPGAARPYGDYRRLDSYALAAPPSVERSVDTLAQYLQRGAHSQEDKARLIFRWLTDRIAYDVPGFLSGHAAQDYASALADRRAVCAGYTDLFLKLAERMNLPAAEVIGITKNNHLEGESAPAQEPKHSWVAVNFGNGWGLIDPTWGAGPVTPEGRFQKSFNDYWYCTPPEQLIYDHFPDQERWQLLRTPWSAEQFRSAVRTSHFFFQYGLEALSHTQYSVTARNDFRMRFRTPGDLYLTADLLQENGQSLGQEESWTLTSCRRGLTTILVRCPRRGVYKLKIYGRRADAVEPRPVNGARRRYNWIAEYQVEWTRAGPTSAFPKTFTAYVERQAELGVPTQSPLTSRRSNHFRVTLPGAQAAKLVYQGGELPLTSSGSSFQGDLTPPPGKLTLYALYPDDPRYFGLAEYEVR